MVAETGVISYPIPAYQNVPINAQYYQPSRFVITAITLGLTTTVTTSTAHNYVIGQEVRFIIPIPYGSFQLNEQTGYVISIPSITQVVVSINSLRNVDTFNANPFVATISNITIGSQAVLTVDQPVYGNSIYITGVVGMTQINGKTYRILSQRSTSITIDWSTLFYSAYISGGTATALNNIQPQIFGIGDINCGATNTSGRVSNITYIPGSYINISPL